MKVMLPISVAAGVAIPIQGPSSRPATRKCAVLPTYFLPAGPMPSDDGEIGDDDDPVSGIHEGWVVTLRNPSPHAQTFDLDFKTALQLPAGAPETYSVHQAFVTAPPETISTKVIQHIALKPFEVRVFESTK
jgi:hypothetical protein